MFTTSHKLGKALRETGEKGYRYIIHHTHINHKENWGNTRVGTSQKMKPKRPVNTRGETVHTHWTGPDVDGWQRVDKKAEHGESLDSAVGAEMGSATLENSSE